MVAQHEGGDVRHRPGVAQPVVGDHVAVKVVGADLFVAVHVAHLALARGLQLLLLRSKLALVEMGAEPAYGFLFVLGLGPLLLALHNSS